MGEKAHYTMADGAAEKWGRAADTTILVITAATAVANEKMLSSIKGCLAEANVIAGGYTLKGVSLAKRFGLRCGGAGALAADKCDMARELPTPKAMDG